MLLAVTQSAAQLECALHQRIVGNEGVGPHRLHQFLLADQTSGMFHKISKGFIYLWAQLDLLACFEHTPPDQVQRELAEYIVLGALLQMRSRFRGVKQLVRSNFVFSLALFRYFPWPWLLFCAGQARRSVSLRVLKSTQIETLSRANSSKNGLPKNAFAIAAVEGKYQSRKGDKSIEFSTKSQCNHESWTTRKAISVRRHFSSSRVAGLCLGARRPLARCARTTGINGGAEETAHRPHQEGPGSDRTLQGCGRGWEGGGYPSIRLRERTRPRGHGAPLH